MYPEREGILLLYKKREDERMNVLVFVDLLFSVHLFVFVFFYIRGLLREREREMGGERIVIVRVTTRSCQAK
jgi:uncharacterized membrane protein